MSKEYRDDIRKDKIELLKLKQGLESDVIKEEESKITKPKGFWANFKNFIYYYKFIILIVACLVCVFGYVTYTIVTQPKADIRVLVITANDYSITGLYDVEGAIEAYTPDFNEDGKVHVDVVHLCVGESGDSLEYSTNRTMLFGEVATAESMFILADERAIGFFEGDDGYTAIENLREKYPNNLNINENGFYIDKTDFVNASGLYQASKSSELFFMVRKADQSLAGSKKDMQTEHDKAITVLENIMNNNKVSETVAK